MGINERGGSADSSPDDSSGRLQYEIGRGGGLEAEGIDIN